MASIIIDAPLLISAAATFIPVGTVVVGLRLLARRRQEVGLGLDDYTCILALIFTIVNGALLIDRAAKHELGYHSQPEDGVTRPDSNYAIWVPEIISVVGLGFMKASFVFLYRRIFKYIRSFNIALWITLALVVAWTISFFFSFVFICKTDFWAYWTSKEVEQARCNDTLAIHDALVIADFLLDILIVFLPLPMIWKLNLTPSRKVGVGVVFLLGALALAASCLRMAIYIPAVANIYTHSYDFQYLATNAMYWTQIELGLGLCATCLPILHHFVKADKKSQTAVTVTKSGISLHSVFNSHAATRRNSQDGMIGTLTPRLPHTDSESDRHLTVYSASSEHPCVESEVAAIDRAASIKHGGIMVTRNFTQETERVDI